MAFQISNFEDQIMKTQIYSEFVLSTESEFFKKLSPVIIYALA